MTGAAKVESGIDLVVNLEQRRAGTMSTQNQWADGMLRKGAAKNKALARR